MKKEYESPEVRKIVVFGRVDVLQGSLENGNVRDEEPFGVMPFEECLL